MAATRRTPVVDDLAHPIVQAPMAGGHSTPELAVAADGAGALGFLAAGYLTADRLAADMKAVRERGSARFGVNLFVPGSPSVDEPALRAYVGRLAPAAERLGVELGEPRWEDDDWSQKLALLHDQPAAVVSFTFGCPPVSVVRSLQSTGSEVWVTVTSLAEARAAAAAGADALVAQGIEAGGHQGTFDDGDGEGLGVLALVRLLVSNVPLPVVAAGAIADGPALAAVLAAGACAGQVGTALLLAPEAGTHPAHRTALGTETPTALTRAFSGRRARGLRNQFLEDHEPYAVRAYPHVHHATVSLRAAARDRNDPDAFNLWAGQAHALARPDPAAATITRIAAEARAALASASAQLNG